MVPLAFGWRDALFANWPVDPDAVAARLPDALSVQTREGDAWLTVLPFLNVDVRPRGLPAALGVAIPEVNLRTYVVRDGEPGIYFFSLDAESAATVVGARLTHRLPYYYARIDVDRPERIGGRVRFESRRRHPGARPARFAASYGPVGEPERADEGSLAAFLTERRRLYTLAQDGSLRYTDVSHGRWPLYAAEWSPTANTLFEASGFAHPGGDPLLYYSPGVDVVTSRSRRWAGEAPGRRGRASGPDPASSRRDY